ncbi:phosphate propanoyltransferase [Caniella muris]|uniref:phosphate propanoyltransferase n=1 Tax=Caniella muris TaxID=2941502 RepID=UPI0020424C69|nr:phosphate propanoyltransferase [Caniella muris]
MSGEALRDLAGLLAALARGPAQASPPTATLPPAASVPVGVSGRHVHLSQADLEALFGPGARLTPLRELSQPGQFAAEERVTLVGPKGVIQHVRVLGPVRARTQVEVLRGDTYRLGIKPCVRLSGHIDGTPGVTLVGPAGAVTLTEGVIVAARHLHLSPEEAVGLGLRDGQVVSLLCEGERPGRLDGVVVRASGRGALDCHIDTEEANAFGLVNGSRLRLVV